MERFRTQLMCVCLHPPPPPPSLALSLCRLRERAVREMLSLYCPLQRTEDSDRRERFLTERLLLPEQWLHEAKAMRARRDGDRHQEALHLYQAGSWNHCHKLLIQHLASGRPNAAAATAPSQAKPNAL